MIKVKYTQLKFFVFGRLKNPATYILLKPRIPLRLKHIVLHKLWYFRSLTYFLEANKFISENSAIHLMAHAKWERWEKHSRVIFNFP